MDEGYFLNQIIDIIDESQGNLNRGKENRYNRGIRGNT